MDLEAGHAQTVSSASNGNPDGGSLPLPSGLESRNPAAWLTIFGPGAVIASLTIGSGELIFSSRGGALFGYRLLWFFLLVLLLKWALVFVTARHMVLTGAHPFQRWMDLPGPRGWFPLVFFLLALLCFPIWVCFHSGTVGTLLSWLAGTTHSLHGGAHFVWGLGTLAVVLALVFRGGYAALERIQLVIVLLMLACVVVSLFAVKPDWLEFFKGFIIPQPLAYPDWAFSQPELANRPVWVETITYVGVIGGSGYDYLAYVSYLRDKHWGQAGRAVATAPELAAAADDRSHINRRWLRAVAVDSVMSFVAVLIFSGVFVACGAVILGPQHRIPAGSNLLDLQAEFVTPIYPWLKHVYFVGAFLTIFGTLYGTIEVAPTVLRELVNAFNPDYALRHAATLRRIAVSWSGFGGFIVLALTFFFHLARGAETPPGLIALLTPANLFTGVLACGLICLLAAWTDWKFLPPGLRAGSGLTVLNAIAGGIFVALGIKGYWDYRAWTAFLILAGTLAAGGLGAAAGKVFLARTR
jgi:hypothetical protein